MRTASFAAAGWVPFGVFPLIRIDTDSQERGHGLDEVVFRFLDATHAVVLTGAGVSVESGIPDFRGDGGLWRRYPPEQYATIETFQRHPTRSWELFTEIGRTLIAAHPNDAHRALARLEKTGHIHGIITQNIDNLHQVAGSVNVVDVHGNFRRLHCLDCHKTWDFVGELTEDGDIPQCPTCGAIAKPDIVLFGEPVKDLEIIEAMLEPCDFLLVIGTSSEVYPVAGFPDRVSATGGYILEFNLCETPRSRGEKSGGEHAIFLGPAGKTVRSFAERALEISSS